MKIKDPFTRLKNGNTNYQNDSLNHFLQDAVRRKDTLNNQDPFAIILTCSDSRVVPELIFDTGIGELFVIRIAGNIANASSIASIEYAVAHLDVKLIVVLAHQNCGAVTAAADGKDNGKNLNHLLSHIKPAINETDIHKIDDISITNSKLTAEKLVVSSQIIAKAIKSDDLRIIPAYYNLDSGKVDFFE